MRIPRTCRSRQLDLSRGLAAASRSSARAAVAIALGVAVLAAPVSVRAARPMITDDARVVDPKSCQLESWVRRNASGTEFWALPACSVGERTELTVGGAMGRDDDRTRATDVVVQFKHLLRPLDERGWAIGVAAGHVSHPAVNRRANLLGDVYATLLASAALRGEALLVHANLGWLHQRERHADRATWGLGFEAQLAPRWILIGESFGQDAGRPWWQLGVRHWLVPGRVQVDATAGDRWGGPGGEHWLSIGIRLLSPPFLP